MAISEDNLKIAILAFQNIYSVAIFSGSWANSLLEHFANLVQLESSSWVFLRWSSSRKVKQRNYTLAPGISGSLCHLLENGLIILHRMKSNHLGEFQIHTLPFNSNAEY